MLNEVIGSIAIVLIVVAGAEEVVRSESIVESLSVIDRDLTLVEPSDETGDAPPKSVPRASVPLLFDLHSDEITSQNVDQLREIGKALQELGLKDSRDLKLVQIAPEEGSKEKEEEIQISRPEQKIVLEGYTCDLGDELENLTLSKERAKSVKAFLVGAGFDPDSIVVVGYGEAFPLEENISEEARRENRRVEIVLSHTTVAAKE